MVRRRRRGRQWLPRTLAVDQSADEKNDKPVLAAVVTVEVSTLDAQKLALAQSTGSISLSLRASGSLDQAPPQRVVEEELVSSPSVYMAKLDARDLAQKQLEATLTAKIASVEDKIVASDTSKAVLSAKLLEIEKRLQGDIANAGEDAKSLRQKYADLEAAIAAADGKTNEELSKRLAEFEASLRGLSNKSRSVVVVEPASEQLEPVKTTVTIGVTRGIKREAVEVPQDGL